MGRASRRSRGTIGLLFASAACLLATHASSGAPLPSWSVDGTQGGADFGARVFVAGDVNGDGFSDVLIAAPRHDGAGDDAGKVWLYLGSSTGLSATAAWTAAGSAANENFGASAAAAGDVNGDGFDDVVVGAPGFGSGALAGEGRVVLYLGSAAGLAAAPAWSHHSGQGGAQLGISAAYAGDVNGDGYADVITGAQWYDNGQAGEGRAMVFLGSAAGLGAVPAWTVESDQASAGLGHSVATAGDVNGDGFSDVIVGAWNWDSGGFTNNGRALVWLGSAAGLAATPAWSVAGDVGTALFGTSVSTAGDVNGDGYSDVIVGAYGYPHGADAYGRALVYLGSAVGLGTQAAWTFDSDQVLADLGWSVGTAGDLNGDGHADLAIGARKHDAGQTDEGKLLVFYGAPDGPGVTPGWTAEGDQDGALFGSSVAAAGDVDGDGFGDLLVGAPSQDGAQADLGRVVLFRGAGAVPPPQPTQSVFGPDGSGFSYAVGDAGDVNGDGFSDVIVGSKDWDGGETDEGRAQVFLGSFDGLVQPPVWTAESNAAGARFGRAVAGAGDVNGDGYADVVVGAFRKTNPESEEGGAYVYLGGPSGLGAQPAWTAESDQAGAQLGYAVDGACDVNGDGFSDVVVGVYLWREGTIANAGQARVYLGSAGGVAAAPAWTFSPATANARVEDVACLGDVNGDGFGDVAVGSPYAANGEANEGRVFVFHGAASGLPAAPSWIAEPNEASVYFGTSVARAGDVNGDGFGDLVVGTPYRAGNTGRAYVYYGSATGLASSPSWIATGMESNAHFGQSVASAGDVDGDGDDEVVVGAPLAASTGGRTRLYRGSPSGLGADADWTFSGPGGTRTGFALAGGGDVDGDGYADLVVGCEISSGIRLFPGNDAIGVEIRARQRRVDGAAPIALGGRSDQPDAIRVLARGRSAAGREKARLEWEVEPIGTPFDGQGLGRASGFTDTGVPGATGSVVELNQLVDGLRGDTRYRWRARVRARNPLVPGSAWFRAPGVGRGETSFVTQPGSTGGGTGTLTLRVRDAADNAYQNFVDPPPPAMSTGEGLPVVAAAQPFWQTAAGFRFAGVGLDRGATITAAYLELYHLDPRPKAPLAVRSFGPRGTFIIPFEQGPPPADDLQAIVYGEAADNAASFAAQADVTGRPRTRAEVPWSKPALAGWQRSPDIRNVVAEIIERPGWQSGNAITLFVEGVEGTTPWRSVYPASVEYQGGQYAAKLVIERGGGGGGEPPAGGTAGTVTSDPGAPYTRVVVSKRLGGGGADGLSSVARTLDGGLLLGGSSDSRVGGDKTVDRPGTHFWLVRLDRGGPVRWQRAFGGGGNDRLASVAASADGGFLVAGTSDSPAALDKTTASDGDDFWALRLDAEGALVWQTALRLPGDQRLAAALELPDGGFVLAGTTAPAPGQSAAPGGFGREDFWLVRLDRSGQKQWERAFGSAFSEELAALALTRDGGLLLAGSLRGEGSSPREVLVFSTTPEGATRWSKMLTGSGDDAGADILATADGAIVAALSNSPVSGARTAPPLGGFDYWIVGLDDAGNVRWDKAFGGAQDDRPASLAVLDEQILVGGTSASPPGGNKVLSNPGAHGPWIVALSPSGEKLWEHVAGDAGTMTLADLDPSGSPGLVIAGPLEAGATIVDYAVLVVDYKTLRPWARLRRTLDGGGFRISDRTLRFVFENEYAASRLPYRIYGPKRDAPLMAGEVETRHGDNRIAIPLRCDVSATGGLTLEIENAKKEVFVLRFHEDVPWWPFLCAQAQTCCWPN